MKCLGLIKIVFIKAFEMFKFICDEQDKLCPVCGYYCTGKSAFCLPPLIEKDNDE